MEKVTSFLVGHLDDGLNALLEFLHLLIEGLQQLADGLLLVVGGADLPIDLAPIGRLSAPLHLPGNAPLMDGRYPFHALPRVGTVVDTDLRR